jgi:26S proteasome regulatory subunit T5
MTEADLIAETRRLENEKRKMDQTVKKIANENKQLDARIKENQEKLKRSCELPHMVANVAELLDVEDEEEEGKEGSGFAIKKTEMQKKTKKALVIKTTGRGTYYLPVLGMVEPEDLKPNELVAVNKESFVVYEKLPAEYDSRVKAMEIDEKPSENYGDVGGLDKQL